MKAQVADVFLEKFQLKPDEVKSLRGTRDGTLHEVCIIYIYIGTVLVFRNDS